MYDLDILIRESVTFFWFRRDLRLKDNVAMFFALKNHKNVLPIFIFDEEILKNINLADDLRIEFIEKQLKIINSELIKINSSIFITYGNPTNIFDSLIARYNVDAIYFNLDFEPYSIKRDEKILQLCKNKKIKVCTYLDHLIFHPSAIHKSNGEPYSVFTPYKNKWLETFRNISIEKYPVENHFSSFIKVKPFIFKYYCKTDKTVKGNSFPDSNINISILENYHLTRDFPALDGTSKLSVHLRFGTISIRELINIAAKINEVFFQELIWREFFIMILYFYPNNINKPFRPAYNNINWLNDEEQFIQWCEGNTGYPIVDAGMRQINATGFMHNRTRMIVASFLTKHLLIDWRWGEAYFAEKLLDYELAVNNGNWQWAAGTGCDAAPYFRIFNPMQQAKKFDSNNVYISKWVKEFNTKLYPKPIVNHEFARKRCLETYKRALIT